MEPVGGCVVRNEFPSNAALLSQYPFICHCCAGNVVAACCLKCEGACGGLEVTALRVLNRSARWRSVVGVTAL